MENIIESTKEFTKFKSIDGNRFIDSVHVNKLKNSIKEENLLHLKPILVDEDFFVIDGQHRLMAAEQLDTPIFYIKTKSNNYSEVYKLNQNNKNWKTKDFLNYHAIRYKNQNYIKILEVLRTFDWDLQTFFMYSSYNIKRVAIRKEFEDGLYIFDCDIEILTNEFSLWKSVRDFCEEKGLEHKDCVNSLIFKDAFSFFMNSKSIKKEQFWEKFRSNPATFHRCRNKDDYIDMLLRVYNRDMTYRIEKGMLV